MFHAVAVARYLVTTTSYYLMLGQVYRISDRDIVCKDCAAQSERVRCSEVPGRDVCRLLAAAGSGATAAACVVLSFLGVVMLLGR